MEQVKARADVTAQEPGLGEAEIDLLAQRAPFDAGDHVLAPAAEVAFRNAQVDHEAVDGAEARADGQFACRLLLDGDIDDRTVRRGAAGLIDRDFLEEAQRPQIVARPLQQGAVEGVAFGQHQLAPDDRVDGAGVADDVDAIDVDTLAFRHVERDVDGVGLGIRTIGRVDVDEGVARRARRKGQGVDRALDLVTLVQVAGPDRQQQFQEVRVQAVVLGHDLDVAEVVLVTLFDRQGHGEGAVVRRQFGHGRGDAEVVVAPVRIEFPQLLAVIIKAAGVVVVVLGKQPPPLRLLGHHDLAQLAVGEGVIAQEGDRLDARLGALVDLEDQVDAVLFQLDQLGRHVRRDTARQTIQLNDLAHILLDPGAGVDAARRDGHFLAQLVLADRAVPLEHDLVDDRVLDDADDQVAVRLQADLDIGEQLGSVQGADRDVQDHRVDGVARLDRQVGQDRGLVDALVALNQDAVDHSGLGRGRLGGRRGNLAGQDGGRRRGLRQGRRPRDERQKAGRGHAGPAQVAVTRIRCGAEVVQDHAGNHRGLASAQLTSPPRNLNRFNFCRSFQVANNIKPASKARPTRYPAS